MAIVTVGIDLAKNVFAVHALDEAGEPVLVGWCNTVVGDALSELTHLDARIKHYDQYIEQSAKEDVQAKQLMR